MCQMRVPASHLNRYPGWTLLFLLTLFGLIFQGSDGVKDVQLEGPRYARRGEDLMLRCNYDLETDSLYAVKWYRGSEEFYRFLPKESPPKQMFPIQGVVVDVNKSDDHNVFIRNISFETNGRFKCVISAEGTFQTLENAKDIDIVVIDYNSPRLYLDKMSYQPGDRGIANCSIENTFPAPNITWFINSEKVTLSVLTQILPVGKEENQRRTRTRTPPTSSTHIPTMLIRMTNGSVNNLTGNRQTATEGSLLADDLYNYRKVNRGMKLTMNTRTTSATGGNGANKEKVTSSVSTLNFTILSYSPVTIKCTGQLYDVYNETSSIRIQPKAPLRYPNPTQSTPNRSRQNTNYGLPDQLQTFNATRMMNDATFPTPVKKLMAVTFFTLLLPHCSIKPFTSTLHFYRI